MLKVSDLGITDEGIICIPHEITSLFLHQNDGQGRCVIQYKKTKAVTYIVLI